MDDKQNKFNEACVKLIGQVRFNRALSLDVIVKTLQAQARRFLGAPLVDPESAAKLVKSLANINTAYQKELEKHREVFQTALKKITSSAPPVQEPSLPRFVEMGSVEYDLGDPNDQAKFEERHAKHLKAYKKSMRKNKKPTLAQQDAYNLLSPNAQRDIDEELALG